MSRRSSWQDPEPELSPRGTEADMRPTRCWNNIIAVVIYLLWAFIMMGMMNASCVCGQFNQWKVAILPAIVGAPIVGLFFWLVILCFQNTLQRCTTIDPAIYMQNTKKVWVWFVIVCAVCCLPFSMTCGQMYSAESLGSPSGQILLHCNRTVKSPSALLPQHANFVLLKDDSWDIQYRYAWKQKVSKSFCIVPMVYTGNESSMCNELKLYLTCPGIPDLGQNESVNVASCGEEEAARCHWDKSPRNMLLRQVKDGPEEFFQVDDAEEYHNALHKFIQKVGDYPKMLFRYNDEGPSGLLTQRRDAEFRGRLQAALVLVLFGGTLTFNTLYIMFFVSVREEKSPEHSPRNSPE